MKRKFLEDLGLEKEVIDKILDQNSQDIGVLKKQNETLEERVKQLGTDIETRDTQLGDLKKLGNPEELQRKLDEAIALNDSSKKEYEEKIANMKFDSAIEKALTGAKHIDLLSTKFDRTKLKLNDKDEVEGIEEQLKAIKESYKDLFTPEKNGKTPFNNDDDFTGITVEQFNKMSYSERTKLYSEDHELYTQLVGGNE